MQPVSQCRVSSEGGREASVSEVIGGRGAEEGGGDGHWSDAAEEGFGDGGKRGERGVGDRCGRGNVGEDVEVAEPLQGGELLILLEWRVSWSGGEAVGRQIGT